MDQMLTAWRDAGQSFAFRGHRIFYRREGRGTPVLAIHGYPLGSFDFASVWDALARAHDVMAPDMLGFGFSDKPRTFEYSFDALTDLHEALLRELGIERVHVLAFDLGTAIAQELVARHEEGRGSVALTSICFLNGNLFPELYRPRLVQRVLASPLGGFVGPRLPRAAVQRAIASVFGPATKPSARELERFWVLVDHGRGRDVTHVLNRLIFAREHHRQRWVRAMQTTRVPMRFVNGPADPNSGEHMARRYEALIPDADVVRVGRDIGHWPTFEAPGETAAAVLDLFERAARRE